MRSLAILCLLAACGGASSATPTPATPTPETPAPRRFAWGIGRFGCVFNHDLVPEPPVLRDFLRDLPDIEVARDDLSYGADEAETVPRVCIDQAGVRVMCVVPNEEGEGIERFILLGGDAGTEDGFALGDTLAVAQTFYPDLTCSPGEGETWGATVCASEARPWLRLVLDAAVVDAPPGEPLDAEVVARDLAAEPVTQVWNIYGPWSDPGWTRTAADE